jgi:glycerol-3-phosphate dehydrogenase (NAD(P)+)
MSSRFERLAILGGGSWGTALAVILSRARPARPISFWVHDPSLAATIERERENRTYLPGFKVGQAVHASCDVREVVSGAQLILGVMPSAHARDVYTQARPHLAPDAVILSATKGLEPTTHLRMSEVVTRVCGKTAPPVAVLSGPSFAAEAARGEPTAVVVAAADESLAKHLQATLAAPNFRLYTNGDVVGVELAGAMKNVMAIAAGACAGLGLGSNSLAALITRGLAEMSRLATALAARPETLAGLAGIGDLVLTCTGALSRNRHVGMELGKGRTLKDVLSEMRMVAEGVGTAAALLALAKQNGVEMPITEQVNAILSEGRPPKEAIRSIMERPPKRE